LSSVLVGNVVVTEVWLVDETEDPPVYHPELVELAVVRLKHNGHNLLSAEGDRYNGTEDGSIKFIVLNPSHLDNLTVEVELEDTSGTTYTGHAPVMKEPDSDAMPRNPVDVY